jgi:hypothetical protein
MQDSLIVGVVMTFVAMFGAFLIVVAINHAGGTKQQSEHQTAQLVPSVNYELTLPDLANPVEPFEENERLLVAAEAA